MKMLLYVAIFCLLTTPLSAQNISGKWVGKVIQGPGELCKICNFELDLSHKKTISGESYTYIKDTTNIRIGLSGYIDNTDSIRLQEDKEWIIRDKVPLGWYICIRKMDLKYHYIAGKEFLIGHATAISVKDNSQCIPGDMILSRNINDLNSYLAEHKDSVYTAASLSPPISNNSAPIPEFTQNFNSTIINKISVIEVDHPSLQIRLNDYLNVDNDTVSVYLNRVPLAKNVRISKRPVRIDFKLDNRVDLNEILLFAENLGRIPPNTSMMLIIDGNKTHTIKIESDKQKTAAIYLRYKPIKSK